MTKVLVLNSPLHGHVYPMLAVAQGLAQRGENVICYLTEEFEKAVVATGSTFRPYHSISDTYDVMSDRLSRFLVEECRHVIPQVLEAVQAEQPDYILYESICLWGRLIAHSLHVPTIACRIMLAENEHFMVLPDVSPTALALNILYRFNDLNSLKDLCMTYNLPFLEKADMYSLFLPYAEDLNIVFVPCSFQPAGESFDERFVFVGPCLGDRAEASIVSREDLLTSRSHPTLYISQGTLFNARAYFFRQCIQAFGGQPWQVILAIGQRVEHAELFPIPDNIQVYTHVSQLDVLQQTSVFLTHGGTNSVMEALFYGVPMVVIPAAVEQTVYAKQIAELGLGVVIEPKAVTVERLQAAVNTVATDPRFRQRAQQMQATIRAAGGTRRAVDAILQFVSSHGLRMST
jgi:MGT family glycosyltransferase